MPSAKKPRACRRKQPRPPRKRQRRAQHAVRPPSGDTMTTPNWTLLPLMRRCAGLGQGQAVHSDNSSVATSQTHSPFPHSPFLPPFPLSRNAGGVQPQPCHQAGFKGQNGGTRLIVCHRERNNADNGGPIYDSSTASAIASRTLSTNDISITDTPASPHPAEVNALKVSCKRLITGQSAFLLR